MKTIISTFGEEPEGIIQGIKQNGCEKLILLIPEKLSVDSKRGLEKVETLTKEMEIQIEKIVVSPYDMMENIKKIKRLVAENADDVILNITGGRKTLSLAASLAGFVSLPKDIIYIQEENNQSISIPKFTLTDKLLRPEKMEILKCIKANTTMEEIKKSLKNDKSKKYHTIMKHLRELAEMELIEIINGRQHTYTITPGGELLR